MKQRKTLPSCFDNSFIHVPIWSIQRDSEHDTMNDGISYWQSEQKRTHQVAKSYILVKSLFSTE
jgi:hypothetical protein